MSGGGADGLRLGLGPGGGAEDAVAVAAVGVARGDLHHFLQQTVIEGGRVETQLDEAAVVNDQIILHRFVARVGQVVHLRAGESSHLLGQFSHLMTFGHLIEDLDPFARFRRILKGQLHAAHRITDVDEGAGLASGAVHREWVADRSLHQEAIENGAVVTVVIEAVGQARVAVGGIGVGAPDDALVQVGDADLVVLVVVEEQQLIERLGHVVDAARAGRMEDLLLEAAAVRLGHLHLEVALGNRGAAVGAVAVHTHGAEVHHMDVLAALHDGGEQVVGAVDVVVDGVALGGAALHRVGRCSLLSEMNNGIRLLLQQQIEHALVLVGDVHVHEAHGLATDLLPGLQPLADGGDRGE